LGFKGDTLFKNKKEDRTILNSNNSSYKVNSMKAKINHFLEIFDSDLFSNKDKDVYDCNKKNRFFSNSKSTKKLK
jgi:hypothetical protein